MTRDKTLIRAALEAADKKVDAIECCNPIEAETINRVLRIIRALDPAAILAKVGADEALRDRLTDAVYDAIGNHAYDCNRVWEAWSYGTMSHDDFVPITDDPDRIAEIVDVVIAAIPAPPQENTNDQ